MSDILKDNVAQVHIVVFCSVIEDTNELLNLINNVNDELKSLFGRDLQIRLLPTDSPDDVPRCIFTNGGGVNILLFNDKIDYSASLIKGKDWKNHINVILSSIFKSYLKNQSTIERIGIIVQAEDNICNIVADANNKVSIDGFKNSEEKTISYVCKKIIDSDTYNEAIAMSYNNNNPENKCTVTVDCNTNKETVLSQEYGYLMDKVKILLSEIERNLENGLQ